LLSVVSFTDYDKKNSSKRQLDRDSSREPLQISGFFVKFSRKPVSLRDRKCFFDTDLLKNYQLILLQGPFQFSHHLIRH